jgi:hypothetical protein
VDSIFKCAHTHTHTRARHYFRLYTWSSLTYKNSLMAEYGIYKQKTVLTDRVSLVSSVVTLEGLLRWAIRSLTTYLV